MVAGDGGDMFNVDLEEAHSMGVDSVESMVASQTSATCSQLVRKLWQRAVRSMVNIARWNFIMVAHVGWHSIKRRCLSTPC